MKPISRQIFPVNEYISRVVLNTTIGITHQTDVGIKVGSEITRIVNRITRHLET